jgi:chromosomal replication initiator protein
LDISINTVWQKTIDMMRDEVSEVSFTTWFSDLEPVKLIDHTLYIRVQNTFNKSILESRYLPLTNNTLSNIAKDDLKVCFILNDSEIPEDAAASKTAEAGDDEPEFTFRATSGSNLNPKYTFEKFVIGENNRFAHAACVAVSEFPSERYNPLFIYGGVGLGKTHLMQAIGNYIAEYSPQKKVVYVSCETFTNEFIDSIKNQNSGDFRGKYRNVDILLIDDIQFLAKKEGTQEEFFHTFNTLHEDNKQIVISSDRPPREIPNLAERLRSRFEMGLITDISTPNFETRIAILRKKAESYKEEIPDEVLSFIADNIHSNIRELEGALTTVVAYSKLRDQTISLAVAQEALKDLFRDKENIVIDAAYIKEMTAKYFNITVDEMDSKKRTKAISTPRQVAMYLTREMTDLSLPKIGEEFGGRDHSTIIHGCQKIADEMAINTDFKNLIIRIQNEIQGN